MSLLKLLLIPVLLFACGEKHDAAPDSAPPLEDVLTLELSFGDDESLVEYLLARPTYISINDKGEIYIPDEKRIKVFNPDGSPKKIFSGPGQGPGEMDVPGHPWFSEDGYYSIRADVEAFNLFDPDDEFVRKISFRHDPAFRQFKRKNNFDGLVQQIKLLDIDHLLFHVSARIFNGSDYDFYDIIFARSYDSYSEVARYDRNDRSHIISSDNRGGANTHFLGYYYWETLSGNRMVFNRSALDVKTEEEKHFYILHIYDLDDGSNEEIEIPYEPVPKSEFVLSRHLREPDSELGKILRGHQYIEECEFFVPVQRIKTDGKYIFVIRYDHNEKGEFLVDIVDADTGDKIRSAWFPEWISSVRAPVRNCRIYRLRREDDIFPVVEVYRIDPAVYGK